MTDRKAWTEIGVIPSSPHLGEYRLTPEQVSGFAGLELADAYRRADELAATLRIAEGEGSVDYFEQDWNPSRIGIEVRDQKVVRVLSIG